MQLKNMLSLCDTALLGGVGTGCLKYSKDGSTEFSGLVKSAAKEYADKTPSNSNPVSFSIGVKFANSRTFRSAVLGCPAERTADVPVAEISSFEQRFPFAYVNYNTEELCGVSVSLTAFNPVIPQNAIDSAIPAAFFEFTVRNNHPEKAATVSLCALTKTFFSSGNTEFGYDKHSGTSYIELTEKARSVAVRRKGSISLATDSTDFTYKTTGENSSEYFYEYFCRNNGFLSDNADSDKGMHKNISAMLSCHKKIKPLGEEKIRIIIAWNFPYCGEGAMKYSEKNYYYHYFPDVLSCVTYCVTHFQRLKKESLLMKELLEKSNMSDGIKSKMLALMGCIRNPVIRRDSYGILRGISDGNTEKCTVPLSYALEYLFPGITGPSNEKAVKSLISARVKRTDSGEFIPSAYDTDCTPDQICARLMMIVRLYKNYRNCSEIKFFAENWVDIAYMADMLCRTALHYDMSCADFMKVYPAVICTLKAMIDVADVLCDKRRRIYYVDILNCAQSAFDIFINSNMTEAFSYILSTQCFAEMFCGIRLYSDELIKKAAENVDVSFKGNDFFTCACLEKYGYTQVSEKVFEKILCADVDCKNHQLYDMASLCSLMIPAFSGFDYDKNTMTVSFKPDDKLCDSDGTFRGFISFDGAFGFVEQGLDYIEILLLSGEIKVRKFVCSHKPYKAMYGGRIWPCDIEGNTVTLDNNLVVTKNKKLTMLIDVTK